MLIGFLIIALVTVADFVIVTPSNVKFPLAPSGRLPVPAVTAFIVDNPGSMPPENYNQYQM